MKEIQITGKDIQLSDLDKRIVATENKAETIVFTLPKIFGGETDLSTFTFYLQFKNKDGEGEPILLTATESGDNLRLSWQPGASFTQVSGRCQIQLYGLKTSGIEILKWSTKPCYLYIAEDLDPEEIVDLGASVLAQYLANFQDIANTVLSHKNTAVSASEIATQAKNLSIEAKNETIQLKNDTVSAKEAAETAREDSIEAKEASEAAKVEAERLQRETEAARLAALGYRDEAMALAGVGNHVTNPMPHQCQIGTTWYKYGFKITANGTVQFIYEEVV